MPNPGSSAGHRNLDVLIASMQPMLQPETYVFLTLPGRRFPPDLTPVMTFQETEGTTLILDLDVAARHGIVGDSPSRMITLSVHSSLDAIGFLARVTVRLADEGISVNAVSAYFHDHLFVPEQRAEDAVAALLAMAQETRERGRS